MPIRIQFAELILREARAAGIAVGTDGDEIVLLAPLKVPREVRCWFETALYNYKAEIIEVILRSSPPPQITTTAKAG
jgi:hypothetical protein